MTGRRPTSAEIELVDQAITSCRSVHAFLPTPVTREDIETILDVARRVPSGSNIQLWKVYVLTGGLKVRLSESVLAACTHPEAGTMHREEYPYYLHIWINPHQSRCHKVGWGLYSLLGIGRADKERMHAQHACNFRFFDTSVGIIFTISRVMEQGSRLDYGTFLKAAMVAARVRGIDTCPQTVFTQFHRVIAEQLGLTDDEMVVRGMSMGYANRAAIENTLIAERAPVSEFIRFLD